MPEYDVIVVGAGNAELRGGNTHDSGGLFHVNDPGGTGLMSGAVFGRLADAHAAGA